MKKNATEELRGQFWVANKTQISIQETIRLGSKSIPMEGGGSNQNCHCYSQINGFHQSLAWPPQVPTSLGRKLDGKQTLFLLP